jgi:hypothetical protein
MRQSGNAGLGCFGLLFDIGGVEGFAEFGGL